VLVAVGIITVAVGGGEVTVGGRAEGVVVGAAQPTSKIIATPAIVRFFGNV
jgi:hypothetical protein